MGTKSLTGLRGLIMILSIIIINNSVQGQAGGGALYLSNENYLTHGDFVYFGSPDYGFTDKLTIACWIKWTTNPQNYVNAHNEQEGRWANIISIDKHNSKDNGQFWLQHTSNNNNFEWAIQASSRKFIQSTTVPAENVWVYLVGVYDGNSADKKMILYVNGIEEASLSNGISGNIALHSALDRLNIGRLPNGYRLFPGCIDEVRVWKRVLGLDEIRTQMFSKNTINSNSLASYWNMNQPSGTTIFDNSPTPTANGVFYTALVDVHSYTTTPSFTITDSDKNWEINSWYNCQIKTVGGDGVDEENLVTSNTATQLTFQYPFVTTPKLDDLGTGTGMTWYGIQKDGEASQWINSTATVGHECKFVKTQDSTAIGWSGASLSVKISSVPSASNNLSVYFWGAVDLPPTTGESYPSGITRRSNMVWGVREWGDVTSSIFVSYPNITNSFRPATAKLLGRISGSSVWTQISADADTVNRSFYAANISTFNEYSIGMTDEIMPIKLESFTYNLNLNSVNLKWKTSEEINNSGFDVERSSGDNGYIKIGFVKGHGNSGSNDYSFSDNGLNTGSYKYRLKQTDYNGNYEYFALNSTVNITAPLKFSIHQNYPNPANPTSKIGFEIPVNAYVSIEVFDVSGKMVSKLLNEKVNAGYHFVLFSGINLSSGVYYYRIIAKSEKEEYIKTQKLVLIK